MADEGFITALADALGLPTPAVDGQGQCSIPFADDLRVALRMLSQADQVNVAIPLGRVLASERSRLYGTVMLANRLLGEQALPFFALTADATRLVLCHSLGTRDPDITETATRLRALVDQARAHRARFQRDGLLTP